jgi:hypothetical protein
MMIKSEKKKKTVKILVEFLFLICLIVSNVAFELAVNMIKTTLLYLTSEVIEG